MTKKEIFWEFCSELSRYEYGESDLTGHVTYYKTKFFVYIEIVERNDHTYINNYMGSIFSELKNFKEFYNREIHNHLKIEDIRNYDGFSHHPN